MAMVASLRDFVYLEVWSRHGGLEAPSVEKVDIGLCAGLLVVLVGVDSDLLQAVKGGHDGGVVGLAIEGMKLKNNEWKRI